MSAIKVADTYHTMALLGTHLSEAKAEEILSGEKYDHIYICLDADATGEAIKMQLAWRNKIPNMRVIGLEKDIKDMDDVEFDTFILKVL